MRARADLGPFGSRPGVVEPEPLCPSWTIPVRIATDLVGKVRRAERGRGEPDGVALLTGEFGDGVALLTGEFGDVGDLEGLGERTARRIFCAEKFGRRRLGDGVLLGEMGGVETGEPRLLGVRPSPFFRSPKSTPTSMALRAEGATGPGSVGAVSDASVVVNDARGANIWSSNWNPNSRMQHRAAREMLRRDDGHAVQTRIAPAVRPLPHRALWAPRGGGARQHHAKRMAYHPERRPFGRRQQRESEASASPHAAPCAATATSCA